MKVSLNIVRNLINFELPSVDELVLRVNQQLGGVEEVIISVPNIPVRGLCVLLSAASIRMPIA